MQKYIYDGPVMEFDTCVSRRWKASTYAPSENKARSNIAYQFKKENLKSPNTMITLPGVLMVVQRKENK